MASIPEHGNRLALEGNGDGNRLAPCNADGDGDRLAPEGNADGDGNRLAPKGNGDGDGNRLAPNGNADGVRQVQPGVGACDNPGSVRESVPTLKALASWRD